MNAENKTNEQASTPFYDLYAKDNAELSQAYVDFFKDLDEILGNDVDSKEEN